MREMGPIGKIRKDTKEVAKAKIKVIKAIREIGDEDICMHVVKTCLRSARGSYLTLL